MEPDRIVASGAELDRVWRCGRLFVAVIFRADPRVRNAYAQYRARNAPLVASEWQHALQQDITQLVTLVGELELEAFKAWLPKALLFEFLRADGVPIRRDAAVH